MLQESIYKKTKTKFTIQLVNNKIRNITEILRGNCTHFWWSKWTVNNIRAVIVLSISWPHIHCSKKVKYRIKKLKVKKSCSFYFGI